MLISEIYKSKQGEGLLTGQESVFVRTSGCNLRCDFCDTPFTSWNPEGERLAIDAIVDQVSRYAPTHVVITGGEPMLAEQMPRLTQKFKALDWHVTIETAGTLLKDVDCDLMSISPKLGNSVPALERAGRWRQIHEKRRINFDAVQRMIDQYEYQLKFVVCEPEDVDEVLDYCARLKAVEAGRVLLMPEGVDQAVLEQRENWLQEICEQYGFRFCPRMHIVWYGNRRGT